MRSVIHFIFPLLTLYQGIVIVEWRKKYRFQKESFRIALIIYSGDIYVAESDE